MTPSARAPFLDLFKLLVTIILIVLFVFLLWNRPPKPDHHPLTSTPLPPTPLSDTVSPTSPSLTSSPTQAVPSTSTATPAPPTFPATDTATPTLIITLSPTPTPPAPDTATPTVPPVTEVIPTPIVEIPSDPSVCEAIARSQLQVGMQATIVRRLNFRSSPGIQNNWLLTNLPGTQVEIIGGPTCTRYQNGGAYLWWQIKLPDGQIGWSAEASAFGKFYFIEPVK